MLMLIPPSNICVDRGQCPGHSKTLAVRLAHFETHARSRPLAAPTSEHRVIFDTAWEL
jgi:hypothetical protein